MKGSPIFDCDIPSVAGQRWNLWRLLHLWAACHPVFNNCISGQETLQIMPVNHPHLQPNYFLILDVNVGNPEPHHSSGTGAGASH
jgi:hypothetical protein